MNIIVISTNEKDFEEIKSLLEAVFGPVEENNEGHMVSNEEPLFGIKANPESFKHWRETVKGIVVDMCPNMKPHVEELMASGIMPMPGYCKGLVMDVVEALSQYCDAELIMLPTNE